MARLNNWPELLNAFIEEKRHQPFAWGINDCCLFGSDCVQRLTGIDPAEEFRGKYTTSLGAARILKSLGGVMGVSKLKCDKHGWKEIDHSYAQRGDVVISHLEGGNSMGICIGTHAVFAGETGIIFRPMSQAVKSWRI